MTDVADPALQRLIEQVRAARADGTSLDIRGGGTKTWYGEAPQGAPLDVTGLRGISSYEPTELVVTVRAGTPLAELEAALAEKGQCLPFEPPRFDAVGVASTEGAAGGVGGTGGGTAGGTVGGMVAAGLAGPARAAVGGVRDYVLGATLLNGRAEVLSFGGQVMKNVAGYDVARLLAGSLGTLGVICEVSLKVLPVPVARATLRFDVNQAEALRLLNAWGGQPLPLSASAWWQGVLVLRLAGAAAAVDAAVARLGGEVVDPTMADAFWGGLRDQRDEFFVEAAKRVDQGEAAGAALWRLSVLSVASPLALEGDTLVEWGGAQRWLVCSAPAAAVRAAATAAGGHATLYRAQDKSAGVFTPLSAPLARIQRDLQAAFDPDRVFNRARLYPDS
ncbi:MAG: glycolate oxidase subunit GlcE [Rubrivivax sp.]|nr:glycolate oxidase subunit GlcE [Rubrivivax sp.]